MPRPRFIPPPVVSTDEDEDSQLQVLPPAPVGDNVPDPVLEAIDEVVNSFYTGKAIDDRDDKIGRLVHGTEQRSELIQNLMITLDFKRASKMLKAREQIEQELLAHLKAGGLTNAERLGYLAYLKPEVERLEKKFQMQGSGVKDWVASMEKLDFSTTLNRKAITQKLSGTTPVAREMMRRAAVTLQKILEQSKAAEG